MSTTSEHYNLILVEGTDLVNPLTQDVPNYRSIDANMWENRLAAVQVATEIKSGTVHALTTTVGSGPMMRFTATSDWNEGDSCTVDGMSVTTRLPSGENLPGGAWRINSSVLCCLVGTLLTVYVAPKLPKVVEDGAGAHNAHYRGAYLGSVVTEAQYAAIAAGTFEDLYIGDYWTINGTSYRIAAFDYYYRTGDTECTTHHVTVVPDVSMYESVMNSEFTTTGAYVGSEMYNTNLAAAKTAISSAFGEAHILNHRQYLKNAVTDGYETAGEWYDSTVELMTEQNVYGGKIFGNYLHGTEKANSYTIDKIQYPLFAFRPDLCSNRKTYWLRDVVSTNSFAIVGLEGVATYALSSYALGVRPSFSIIG